MKKERETKKRKITNITREKKTKERQERTYNEQKRSKREYSQARKERDKGECTSHEREEKIRAGQHHTNHGERNGRP